MSNTVWKTDFWSSDFWADGFWFTPTQQDRRRGFTIQVEMASAVPGSRRVLADPMPFAAQVVMDDGPVVNVVKIGK